MAKSNRKNRANRQNANRSQSASSRATTTPPRVRTTTDPETVPVVPSTDSLGVEQTMLMPTDGSAERRARAKERRQARTQTIGGQERTTAARPTTRASERRAAAAQRDKKKQQRNMLIAGLVAAALIAGLLIYLNLPKTNDGGDINYGDLNVAAAPAITALGTPGAQPPAVTNGTILGDPNAPVTMIIYSDMQCPFCRQFHEETLPQVIDDFVRTGKVKIEFREFVSQGRSADGTQLEITDDSNESAQAAEAAMCAGEQDQYLQYQDKLFANWNGENQGAFNNDRLKQFADDLGLNTDSFNACLASGKYEPVLQKMKDEGSTLGVNATPMFVLDNGNGTPNVISMTNEGYNLLKKQLQTAVDTAQ